MKTFVNVVTGGRFPLHGCACWFTEKKNGKWEHHIKPDYKECTHGWKPVKQKEWRQEEIPDLEKPYTREQWISYAKQYGTACAQEFLESCDYMKPRVAYQMFNPPKNEEAWHDPDNQAWFEKLFKRRMGDFIDGIMIGIGNIYSIDIIRFEKHLAFEFGYPMHKDGSMHDFMTKEFGQENTDKFVKICMPK